MESYYSFVIAMIFFYSPEAGKSSLSLEGEDFHYLIRVRRHRVNDEIRLQNMSDGIAFFYHLVSIEKRSAQLHLIRTETLVSPQISLHIAWGICDASTIYSTLPALNQLGVHKISFLITQRSQGNVHLNPEKIKNICIQSSQQCGRNHLLEWDVCPFDNFVKRFPELYCFDMTGSEVIDMGSLSKNIPRMIGPEGGWTLEELSSLSAASLKKYQTPFVLKSEVAVVLAAGI